MWNLESFTLTDEAGNSNKLREEELVKLGIETRHEVFDGLRDYTAPGLISYELSTYSLDIGKGERNINVKATIRDDLSGVFDGRYISGHREQVSKATWKSPSGNQYFDIGNFDILSTGTRLDGQYEDRVKIEPDLENNMDFRLFYLVDEEGIPKIANSDLIA